MQEKSVVCTRGGVFLLCETMKSRSYMADTLYFSQQLIAANMRQKGRMQKTDIRCRGREEKDGMISLTMDIEEKSRVKVRGA